MIAYAIHWLKHLYTSIKKKKTDQAGLRFYNWLQKASICSNMSMRQQRACETEAIILPPNKRHFNFTLIKDVVLIPREEELTRWRVVSSWRNRRQGPGQRCERVHDQVYPQHLHCFQRRILREQQTICLKHDV